MSRIPELFFLLEATRAQPLYGNALSGDRDLSNLSEHHYLVAMFAWRLARHVCDKGCNIDIEKVLELALFHDLGELFGGDIAMPYARANMKARELAKAFEAENQNYLSNFFDEEKKRIQDCFSEITNISTDEGRIVKIADYVELTMYKKFIHQFSEEDIHLVSEKLKGMIDGFIDTTAKEPIEAFIHEWLLLMRETPSYDEAMKKILR